MYEQIDDQILLNFCITWNEEYEDTGCIGFSSTNWPLNYKTNIRIYIYIQIVISNIQISSLHKILVLDTVYDILYNWPMCLQNYLTYSTYNIGDRNSPDF